MNITESQLVTLANGLRVLCRRTAGDVGIFGVAINAGSRDEEPRLHGLAHFVEHTIFKGTVHRRAGHILNRMETVGGELNAFTSKEETNVYSVFPAAHLPRAVELISDLLRNSVFPANELRKEREVVREEIDSYLDSPADAVFDDFEDRLFAGSQLGHNILGESSNLDSFTPETCRRYILNDYTPGRMVAFYQGPESPDKVMRLVERYFGDITASDAMPERIPPVPVKPFAVTDDAAGSHQAHTVMGAPVPGIHSPERHALGLLTNILGGPGMNSRLNVALRERRGLVYTVDANLTLFQDSGYIGIYFGCDPADTLRCAHLVETELRRLTDAPLNPRVLAAAKRQYLGQLLVAADNTENSALQAARTALYFSRVPDPAVTAAAIEALTPEDLHLAARHLSPALFSRLTLT